MERRTFIALVSGGLLATPLAVGARPTTMPVIGFLSLRSPDTTGVVNAVFHQGLNEAGFVEGRNVTIEYRWAEGHNDRFPALAADLVRRHVAVIVAAGGNPSALAAKAATSEIPIVFQVGADPVALGLVASLDRPGRNLTGVTSLNVEVGPKRLQLLHEVVPTATVLGLLVNPTNAASETLSNDAQAAARAPGLQLHVLRASAEPEFDTVFGRLVQLRVAGLLIGNDPFFSTQSARLAALSLRHALPSIATRREFPEAGGLMSYGGSLAEVFRLTGVYTGCILKGEHPADMPVHKSTKLELIINLKTAQALGLALPPSLLARADEVIQ
jgi:putative tryptophan/tyrosine transport system substrate-binding protein